MNETRDSSSGVAIMTGFLLGTLVGAGVALLLAPATGEETRRVVAERARRLSADARDALGRTRESISGLGKDAKSAIKDAKSAVDAGREAFSRSRQPQEQADSMPSEVVS